MLTIIGDIHGDIDSYLEIISKHDFTICDGDFGFQVHWDWHIEYVKGRHYINPGNHDYIPYVNKLPSTGNFGWFPDYSLMTVRGADSIDKNVRLEGHNWFSNEELNYKEQLEAFDWYCKVKPNIMITHDCPQSIMELLFGYNEASSTRKLLQEMYEFHQPKLWIFGHHHKSKNIIVNNVNFICLAPLETITIDEYFNKK